MPRERMPWVNDVGVPIEEPDFSEKNQREVNLQTHTWRF